MSRSFNGSTDVLNQGIAPLTAGPLTVCGWAWLDSTPAAATVYALGNNSASNPALLLDVVAGKSRLFIRDDAANQFAANGATAVTTTGWHHFLATVNSAQTASVIYLDGVSDGTGGGGTLTTWTLNRAAIGAYTIAGANGNFMPGKIAWISAWTAQLVQAEITSLAKGVSPLRIRPSALVSFSPVGLGSPDPDLMQRTRFTVTGTTIAANPPVQPPFAGIGGWRGAFKAAAAGTTFLSANLPLLGIG